MHTHKPIPTHIRLCTTTRAYSHMHRTTARTCMYTGSWLLLAVILTVGRHAHLGFGEHLAVSWLGVATIARCWLLVRNFT